MRVIQIVPSLNYGDAIGNHIIALKHIIADMGYSTAIYTESIHKKITEPDVYLVTQLTGLKPEDVVIYHMSIGDDLNLKVAEYKCRKIMIYHNITPPHFFSIDCAQKVESCQRGLDDVKKMVGKFDYHIAVSEFNKRDLVSMGYDPDTIDVFPIIMDMNDYRQTVPDKSIIEKYNDGYTNILFVGRVAPNKKHEDIIRAFAYYNQEINPKSRLILAGNYDGINNYYTELVEYIKEIQNENIIFTSHISFAEILGLYAGSDMFMCLSEHEGFCVPLVEAMLFDLPIIAFDSCAVPETMGGSGIVIDNKNPVFVAKVMDKVATNQELRQDMIASQRKRLEDFEFEPLSKKFRELLGNFVEQAKKK